MKLLLIVFAGLISLLSIASANNPHDEKNTKNKVADAIDYYEQQLHNLYTKCKLNHKLEFTVFKQALAGYNSLDLSNKKILSIIDFSKPSTEERLFIIDLENPKLLLQTLVAHGKKFRAYECNKIFEQKWFAQEQSWLLHNRQHLPREAWIFIIVARS